MPHIKKVGESWQELGSYKSQIGDKLLNKAWQGQETHIIHCGWQESSGCGKNHLLARQISIYIWCLEISGCKYWLPQPRI